MITTHKLTIPKEDETPYQWALANNIECSENVNWKLLCMSLHFELQGTESAKVCIGRTIRAAIKENEVLTKVVNNTTNAPTTMQPVKPVNGDLASIIANAVSQYIQIPQQETVINEDRIIELIKQHAPIKHIEVSVNGNTNKLEGLVHFQFEKVLKCIAAKVNTMLVGEAGSGKTTIVHNAAQALNIPFYCMSVGAQTTKSDIMGYCDANGVYRSSIFRLAYENGGVFCLDEIDAGNANVITCLNSALSNGVCGFPDGMITKHADFVCVATANTFGTGASRSYVGRNQLDKATLDRFKATVEIFYDEELERKIAGNDNWVNIVQSIRAALKGEREVISPRASIEGAKLLKQGFSIDEVIEMSITASMSDDMKAKVRRAI